MDLDINCEDCQNWIESEIKCKIGSGSKVHEDPEKGVQCPDYQRRVV